MKTHRHSQIAIILLALLSAILTPSALAQIYIDREQVADLVFPPMAVLPGGDNYNSRLILRFANPDCEILIETHPKGQKTVDLYTLAPGLTIGAETGRVQRQNLNATPQQVAASIHVRRTSIKVDPIRVDRWLRALASVSPPVILDLSDWFDHDQVPRYDLWIDSGGASLRYSFTYAGPNPAIPAYPLAPLAQWMLQVRSDVEEIYNKKQ